VYEIALYAHILGAMVWVGSSVLLFGLGVAIRDSEKIAQIYGVIGRFYGMFMSLWLGVLLLTGGYFIHELALWQVMIHGGEAANALWIKIGLVGSVIGLTVLHTLLALKELRVGRSVFEKRISKGASVAIFGLNLVILGYGMLLRDLL